MDRRRDGFSVFIEYEGGFLAGLMLTGFYALFIVVLAIF